MANRLTPYALRQQAEIVTEPMTLTPDAKERLAASGLEFDITKVTNVTSEKYGECWLVEISLKGLGFKFFMSDPGASAEGANPHPEITAEFEALRDVTKDETIVGPYLLEYILMQNGRSFYRLVPSMAPPVLEGAQQSELTF